MSLTEKEVADLAAQVGEPDLTSEDIRRWRLENLASLHSTLNRLRANFALQKRLRNDEAMKSIAGQVEEIRKQIADLEDETNWRP